MLLEIRDGTVSRKGTEVLKHFSFEIRGTEKIAITGRNGAGKTTLLEVLAGERELDADEKNPSAGMFRSRVFTIGMLKQQQNGDDERTVDDLIKEAVQSGKSADFLYSDERYLYETAYNRMFTRFGFAEADKHKKLCEFSGGERIKIALIRLLLSEPDVLILDEPTNHLDLESVEWLEQYIREYRKAVVIVSHDRFFLDRTVDVVWEVAFGKLTRYPGNYTEYRAAKAAAYERQMKAYERQQEEIERQNDLIKKFKNKPRKAAFARSRKKILERMEIIEKPQNDDAVIHTGEIVPARSGSKWVWECEHLKIGYDRQKPIAELSFRLRRGQKVGIVGPNGIGKTTLLKTVAGLLPPLEGKNGLGVNIDAAYFDQRSAELSDEAIVIDWFHDKFPALTEREVRDTLAGYLFKGRDLGKRVKSLSGGEKARLVLASLLQTRPNFLILDEPTNNMDIPAKETLESLFREYKGTILVVSHDRYFLSRVSEALLVFREEAPTVMYYPFGYAHYEERKRKLRAGEDPAILRKAEDQRLIEELKAVPKGERHQLREISTEQATLDWQFDINRRERQAALDVYLKALEELEEAQSREAEGWLRHLGHEEFAEGLQSPGYEEFAESLQNPGNEDAADQAQHEHGKGNAATKVAKVDAARDAWTKTLLDWYDIWLDTSDAEWEFRKDSKVSKEDTAFDDDKASEAADSSDGEHMEKI